MERVAADHRPITTEVGNVWEWTSDPFPGRQTDRAGGGNPIELPGCFTISMVIPVIPVIPVVFFFWVDAYRGKICRSPRPNDVNFRRPDEEEKWILKGGSFLDSATGDFNHKACLHWAAMVIYSCYLPLGNVWDTQLIHGASRIICSDKQINIDKQW